MRFAAAMTCGRMTLFQASLYDLSTMAYLSSFGSWKWLMWQKIRGERGAPPCAIVLLQATNFTTSSGPFQRVEWVIRTLSFKSSTTLVKTPTKSVKEIRLGGQVVLSLLTLITGIPRSLSYMWT